MSNIEKLNSFLQQYLSLLESSSKENPIDVTIDFEISPKEYLTFAEEELQKDTKVSLINCVSHLKRALDCQLDTFFKIYNLNQLFEKRNLKIEKKLQFISAIGFFNASSLLRLNNIRNKMEHQYRTPEINDLEVYFDLVSAVVQILEAGGFEASGSDFCMDSEPHKATSFGVKYSRDLPKIEVVWKKNFNEIGDKIEVLAIDNIDTFAYFFKVLRLLCQFWDRHHGGHEWLLT